MSQAGPPQTAALAGGLAVLLAFVAWFQKAVWTASRTYDREANSVGREYDAWTEEGILEYYWGEHIHLGYYSEAERAKGYLRKNFIQAKYDFIDEMAKWGEVAQLKPEKVLDVGCGIGGTSRYLANMYGEGTSVTGITLSQAQVDRGTSLAKERGIDNARFQVMDALNMDFPDNSFDVVWACESGEHMPDKKRYVEEMIRVLKPGGRIVIATWCQRDETPQTPFNEYERKMLDFLYSEWTHPYVIRIPYTHHPPLLLLLATFIFILTHLLEVL
jgi:MPBQ/MSBQ methyltransferase